MDAAPQRYRNAPLVQSTVQWGGRTPKAGGRELDGRTWDQVPAVPDGPGDGR
jgi:protein gp37